MSALALLPSQVRSGGQGIARSNTRPVRGCAPWDCRSCDTETFGLGTRGQRSSLKGNTCCSWKAALPSAVLATLLNWLLGMLVEAVSTTVRTMGAAPPVHALCKDALRHYKLSLLARQNRIHSAAPRGLVSLLRNHAGIPSEVLGRVGNRTVNHHGYLVVTQHSFKRPLYASYMNPVRGLRGQHCLRAKGVPRYSCMCTTSL